ncbi:MAG: diguanylate cyclase [Ilumatobacteraceae bacterium]
MSDQLAPSIDDEASSSHRAALGQALLARAEEIAGMVRSSWELDQARFGREAEPRIGDDIVSHNLKSTTMMAEHLAGVAITSKRMHSLSRAGNAAADDSMLMADLVKLYLRWRDLVTAAIRGEARRRDTPDAIVADAVATVAASVDSSIVLMARQFDTRREQLHTRLQQDRARLEHQTCHDALTGLPNRTLLFRLLKEAAAAPGSPTRSDAVLFVDVDHFKAINDSQGHAVGDEVLVGLARRLCELVRPGDTVARFAGDEFVIIARGLRDAEADGIRLASRIRDGLAVPVAESTGSTISVSIGVAGIVPGEDPDLVLARADRAMYLAKQGGRARHELCATAT